MKNILHKIKQNFRIKLILCFLLLAVIPVLIIGMTSYAISMNIAKDNILTSADLSSRQVAAGIDDRITQVENVADTVHFYLYTLYTTPKTPLSSYMDTFSTIRNNILTLKDTFDFYQISIFLEPDSIASKEGVYFYSLDDIEKQHVTYEDFSSLGVTPRWMFREDVPFPYVITKGNTPKGILTCYRASAINASSADCIFGIHLTSEELSRDLNAVFGDSDMNAYLVDQNQTIIAGKDADQIGTKYQEDSQSEIILQPVHSGEWRLVTEVPDSYLRENTNVLVQIILLSLVIMVAITILAIMYVSRSLTKKIHLLSAAMDQVQFTKDKEVSQLSSLIPVPSPDGDEIDRLSGSCRHMLDELDTSFQEILDLSVKEERLNYQLLQSQINPHFLYNILASIQTLLSMRDLSRANKMLSDLSRFYRGLLHKTDELIPIREELEIATLYLEMESLCKNGIFDWDIQLDDGIENFLICKFTLQPILENSIHHGLDSRDTRLHIQILITYDDDMIDITISDNGKGMSQEKLTEIRSDLLETSVHYDRHFGISNINSRIRSSLQEYGTMEIDSSRTDGTTVHIRIPQLLED